MTAKKMLTILISAVPLAALIGTTLASEKPSDLQTQIAKTKQEYFTLYNELNTNPQFKMVCRSVFGERICKPLYIIEARQKAKELCSGYSDGYRYDWIVPSCRADQGEVIATATVQEEDFRRNVQEVFQRSPELRALGLKLDELEGRQRPTKN